MLREIKINHALSPIDGVLIKRHHINEAQRADRVIESAQARASQLVRSARDEAENCRLLGLAQGYRDGFYAAALSIADYLRDRSALESTLETVLCERLRALLQQALARPELLLSLVDEWVAQRPVGDKHTIQLTLPTHARVLESQLVAAVDRLAPVNISVSYHEDLCFIVRCADQVARFSPDEFVSTIDYELKHILRTELLPTYGQALMDDAIEKLWYALQEQHPLPQTLQETKHGSDQFAPVPREPEHSSAERADIVAESTASSAEQFAAGSHESFIAERDDSAAELYPTLDEG